MMLRPVSGSGRFPSTVASQIDLMMSELLRIWCRAPCLVLGSWGRLGEGWEADSLDNVADCCILHEMPRLQGSGDGEARTNVLPRATDADTRALDWRECYPPCFVRHWRNLSQSQTVVMAWQDGADDDDKPAMVSFRPLPPRAEGSVNSAGADAILCSWRAKQQLGSV